MDFLDNNHNHEDGELVHIWLNKNFFVVSLVSLSIIFFIFFSLYFYTIRVLQTQHQPRRRANNSINQLLSLNLLFDYIHTLQTTRLDPTIVASLPVFIVEPKNGEAYGDSVMECAVCLSGFEDEEMAKLLPNCEHYFHVECIDMWLASHSTCPLCRAWVQPRLEPQVREVPRTLALDGAPLVVIPVLEPSSEGTSNCGVGEEHKIDGSNSRLSSIQSVLSRERSSRRIHQYDVDEDLERR